MTTSSAISDHRIPPADSCVTRYLLERWSTEMPEKEFAVFQDGEAWTYAALLDKVGRLAGGLAGEGVSQGDHVAVWMFDCKEAILTFFAINYLGAVFVPLNTAYKGKVLEHVLDVSDAGIMVAHGQLLDRLADVDAARITRLVAVGESTAPERFTVSNYVDLEDSDAAPPELD